ncbi:hypothetical protein NC652_034264 [Populus alba x Populus x berolinensis]|nr:hypothetical protein NC652_034264 [Populus alba x Populus x berolinensis]
MGREVRELFVFSPALSLVTTLMLRIKHRKQKKKNLIPEGQSERMMKKQRMRFVEKTGAKASYLKATIFIPAVLTSDPKVGLLSDEVIADYTRYSCDIYSAISPAFHAFNAHPDGKALYSGFESSVHRVITVIPNSGSVYPNVWP